MTDDQLKNREEEDKRKEERNRITKNREEFHRLFPNQYITEICINLRMSCNGSADPWTTNDLYDTVQALKNRLTIWYDRDDKFDNAVKTMVTEAIRIGEEELRERESSKDDNA